MKNFILLTMFYLPVMFLAGFVANVASRPIMWGWNASALLSTAIDAWIFP